MTVRVPQGDRSGPWGDRGVLGLPMCVPKMTVRCTDGVIPEVAMQGPQGGHVGHGGDCVGHGGDRVGYWGDHVGPQGDCAGLGWGQDIGQGR